jgi:hypothetical protein
MSTEISWYIKELSVAERVPETGRESAQRLAYEDFKSLEAKVQITDSKTFSK